MCRWCFLFALLALLAGPVPAQAGADRPENRPPWRVGGRVGFTLDVVTLPEASGLTLDVVLRIPPATLACLSRDEAGVARLRAAVRVKGRFGARIAESATVIELPGETEDPGQGKVVLMKFPAAAGPCQVRVRLTDLLSRRRGLMGSGPNGNESAELAGEFEVPRAQAGRYLSDLQFLWPTSAGATGLGFVRNGRALVPNPDRLYGLYAQELHASFVARSAGADSLRSWHWVARVWDAQGQGVAQRESTAAAGPILDADLAFDLSHEPAGAYELEVKAWQEGETNALSRRSRFSIGWNKETWLRNAGDANDDAHFLLEADAEEAFLTMQPGEQEHFLAEFWARRDPTPESATNEALEVFRARVSHANSTFTRAGLEKGMFSDMGRVYIRYGEPTEITHQVVPAGSETLTSRLEEIVSSEDRAVGGDVRQKGLGGDMRPYEVWVYEGNIPLPPDADPSDRNRGRSRRRMLFLFVDDQGTGVFRLRYSTE